MAGDTTLIGNLTADPELRYTQNGIPVVGFTIAVNERKFDKDTNEWKDGDALFMRVSVWREPAEHVAQSLFKGMRVFATGKLKQRSYEDNQGQTRTVIELEAEEVGPSLRYAVAQVTRADGAKGGNATGQRHPVTPAGEDAWATGPAPTSTGDDVPW